MAKPQPPNAGDIQQPRQDKPSPGKAGEWQNQADGTRTDPPAQGYDTPHEGAVRDEGTENQGGKWVPGAGSPPDKSSKDR
jgi:hypothetical protein